MKLIDAHCHLTPGLYPRNLADVIKRTSDELDAFINTGTTVNTSRDCARLSDIVPNMYFAAGLHPNFATEYKDHTLKDLRDLLRFPKALAIGEIGLDFYRDIDKHSQLKVFLLQLDLALEFNKPIVVHGRNSHPEIVALLSKPEYSSIRVILHSFSGTYAEIENILDRTYVSFSGMITMSKYKYVLDCVRKMPMSRILAETDSPYLIPAEARFQKLGDVSVNHPYNMPFVIQAIADVARRPYEEIAFHTRNNAIRAFKIPHLMHTLPENQANPPTWDTVGQ